LKRSNSKKTLIVILGPTAVGKTALSIDAAKHFKTEIISADSRQFFRELKIGAAPPSAGELKAVKHHFIGNLSISDYYNASIYENEALLILDNLFKSEDIVIMVGGSGLYIDAVCSGLDVLPDLDTEIRNKLKQTYDKEGIEALRFQLKLLDPEYYHKVDLANPKRLIRAIEVCLATGETYSSLRTKSKKTRDFKIIKVGLNRKRSELFEIINDRVDMMIENGLIKEAQSLFELRSLNALNTVGYKELFEYFDKKTSLSQAVENIKTNTRRFAKRQLTWFCRDKEIHWMHPDERNKIISIMEQLLNKKGKTS
jgi:tRNA dimethylallyltransferase